MAISGTSYRFAEVAHHVRTSIERGEVLPGEPLPSVRDMARTLECAPGTVNAAYKDLEQQGLIYSVPLVGYRVARSKALVAKALRSTLQDKVENFSSALKEEGFAAQDIVSAFRSYVKENAKS